MYSVTCMILLLLQLTLPCSKCHFLLQVVIAPTAMTVEMESIRVSTSPSIHASKFSPPIGRCKSPTLASCDGSLTKTTAKLSSTGSLKQCVYECVSGSEGKCVQERPVSPSDVTFVEAGCGQKERLLSSPVTKPKEGAGEPRLNSGNTVSGNLPAPSPVSGGAGGIETGVRTTKAAASKGDAGASGNRTTANTKNKPVCHPSPSTHSTPSPSSLAVASTSSEVSSADTAQGRSVEARLELTPLASPSRNSAGPKYKLICDGDIQVCRLNHTRTIVSKIMSSKFLRRWESHHLMLTESEIVSQTTSGFMEQSVAYSSIEDIHVVARWDAGQRYCMRVTVSDGSVLLQANNAYIRDQWLHSLSWKRRLLRFRKLITHSSRADVLLKEIKSMVEFCINSPLQDDEISQVPMELISTLLYQSSDILTKATQENIISALGPLLENQHPSPKICEFYSKYCEENPRSSVVTDMFTPVAQRILKHNMDFGKFPMMRHFLQSYICALSCQNDGKTVLQQFVRSIHGQSYSCPHPRVLPNVVAVCLAAIYSYYDKLKQPSLRNDINQLVSTTDCHALTSFATILESIATFDDWRPHFSSLLQPIPFPNDALQDEKFIEFLMPIVCHIASDDRCEVHLTVLGIRDGKEGWFHLFCPGELSCVDEGITFTVILRKLISCCCRRKKFLFSMNKMLGPCMLLALRENETAVDIICAMLEMEVVDSADVKLQMITTLQSTTHGKRQYAALCERQIQLRELQQKGGPRKLTLPSKSTDADLSKLLSCGSFGNLECLSLAFTQVTSACAEQLIKLPSLKYLNLWSTQFGDTGLQLISEHLHKLQVLNLCETPVTDKGLISLTAMKNLRKLNLNSTSLSAKTFEGLKEKLPALQECDIRYTEAW